MRIKFIKYIIMALAVIIGIVWYIIISKDKSESGLSFAMEDSSCNEITSDDNGGDRITEADAVGKSSSETVSDKSHIVVYVCGEVQNPGVYEFTEGTRIVSAIEMAGGFSEEAARDFLNLARVMSDGERIEVPSVCEVSEGLAGSGDEVYTISGEGSSTTGKELSVNINTASKEELMELPGIGESRALSIIAYREEHGFFESIEEIMLVSGIKEGAFAKIKAYIKVKP